MNESQSKRIAENMSHLDKLVVQELSEWWLSGDLNHSPYTVHFHNDGEMAHALVVWGSGEDRGAFHIIADIHSPEPPLTHYYTDLEVDFLEKVFKQP